MIQSIQLFASKAILTVLFLGFLIPVSFSQESKKGKWTKAEEIKLFEELNSTREEVVDLVGNENAELFYACAKEKIQAGYNNFAEADADYDGMRAIGKDCMTSLLETGISVKGNWNEADIDRAKSEMDNERAELDELLGVEKVDEFIECVLINIELEYPNFTTADSDMEGIEDLTSNCMIDILTEDVSMKGSWSEKELQNLRAELEKQREELDELVGIEKTNEFIECAVQTIENSYPNFAAAEKDLDGMEKIGADCMTSVYDATE